jgi:hypothetical protein
MIFHSASWHDVRWVDENMPIIPQKVGIEKKAALASAAELSGDCKLIVRFYPLKSGYPRSARVNSR